MIAISSKEIRLHIAMAKTACTHKGALLTGKSNLELRKNVVKCCVVWITNIDIEERGRRFEEVKGTGMIKMKRFQEEKIRTEIDYSKLDRTHP